MVRQSLRHGEKLTTPAGNHYGTLFVIKKTRFAMIFLHKRKTEFLSLLKKAIAVAGRAPKLLPTNGAGEYADKEAQAFYDSNGIVHQTTNPYQQLRQRSLRDARPMLCQRWPCNDLRRKSTNGVLGLRYRSLR